MIRAKFFYQEYKDVQSSKTFWMDLPLLEQGLNEIGKENILQMTGAVNGWGGGLFVIYEEPEAPASKE